MRINHRAVSYASGLRFSKPKNISEVDVQDYSNGGQGKTMIHEIQAVLANGNILTPPGAGSLLTPATILQVSTNSIVLAASKEEKTMSPVLSYEARTQERSKFSLQKHGEFSLRQRYSRHKTAD